MWITSDEFELNSALKKTNVSGLLSHLVMLTPTTEGMLDMVWDTMVSMVVMPAPIVWATVATVVSMGPGLTVASMVAEDTTTAKYVCNSSRDC